MEEDSPRFVDGSSVAFWEYKLAPGLSTELEPLRNTVRLIQDLHKNGRPRFDPELSAPSLDEFIKGLVETDLFDDAYSRAHTLMRGMDNDVRRALAVYLADTSELAPLRVLAEQSFKAGGGKRSVDWGDGGEGTWVAIGDDDGGDAWWLKVPTVALARTLIAGIDYEVRGEMAAILAGRR